jgi:capsular exopolysaccharide synthesis family protein
MTGVDSTAFDSFALSERTLGGAYTLAVDDMGGYELTRADTSAVERGTLGGRVGETFGFDWSPPAEAFRAGAEADFTVLTTRQAVARVRSALSVEYIGDAGIIVAEVTWPDQEQSALLLNTLQDQFIVTATDLKNRQLRQTVSILETQTEKAYERLAKAEGAYQGFRVGAITQPSERQVLPLQATGGAGDPIIGATDPVFGAYFQKRVEERQLGSELDQLNRVLRDSRSAGEVDVLTLMSLTTAGQYPVLQSTLTTLNQKEADRRTLLLTWTEESEQVQLITREIDQIKRVTIPSLVSDLIQQLQQRRQTVAAELGEQTDELRAIPGRTIEQARLQREMMSAESLHQQLQQGLKSAELTEATSSPGLQVLDRASVPLGPTQDDVPRIMLMASLAGLGLGLAGALLLDKMDKRIRYPDEVERGLGLAVLGIVPRLDAASGVDASVAVESFRSIRVQISHSNGNSKGIVLVTSPAPRDGKSMVSANLAISYASAGYKTLLLDTDIRRGHAEEMFGVQRSPGLADYLRGQVAAADIRQETRVDGLTMIAKGSGQDFNLELLDSPHMDALLESLKADFDVVVLDAPPLAAGADALVLGRRADKVIVVLRAGETDQVLARTKLELIGNVNVPIVGAVLNAVPTNSHYYPYYANYYYEAEPV